jgi:hypothetical protein
MELGTDSHWIARTLKSSPYVYFCGEAVKEAIAGQTQANETQRSVLISSGRLKESCRMCNGHDGSSKVKTCHYRICQITDPITGIDLSCWILLVQ